MDLKKRIERLELNLLGTSLDPVLDGELSEWFRSNPDYEIFSQPESNNEVMPEYLSVAFQNRIKFVLTKNNFRLNFCGLAQAMTQNIL